MGVILQRECPICGAKVVELAKNPAFPFCSARCRTIDLGNWLNGTYRTPGQPLAPQTIDDADLEGDE